MYRHDADFVARNLHVTLHFEVGRAQPRHVSLQRGGGLALIVQGKFEKFIERVVGLMAEPSQYPRPAAVTAKQPRIKRKRRLVGEPAFAVFETRQRVPELAVGRGVVIQRLPQRSLALPCQFEQVVVGEAEQRALQRDGERQIVLRQQQRVGEIHQIDDRDVLGQLEPVGAGDRNAGVLQRLDHRIEGVAAPPHQHQHIAVTQRPAIPGATRHGATFDQPPDLGLDAPGEFHFRAGQRHAVERCTPAFDVLLVIGLGQFPEIDQARSGIRQRIVDRVAGFGGMDAAVDRFVAKHVVDRLQDRRSRAERIGERHRIEFQPGIPKPLLQSAAAAIELAGCGTLKRKDRLLLVADRKNRAGDAVAGARARGELGNDVCDDIPLPGAGVLRLVDQHMIDAAIELVMHPARGHPIQHLQRLVDQIVIIEQAALLLLAPVICCRRGRDMQQRLGPIARNDRATAFDQGGEADNFRCEQSTNGRVLGHKAVRYDGSPRRAGVREKHVQIFFNLRDIGELQRLTQSIRLFLVGFAAGIESCGNLHPARSRQIRPTHNLALDVFDPIIGSDAEGCGNLRHSCVGAAGSIRPGHEVIAAQARLAHHILEGDVGSIGHRHGEGAPGGAVGIARGFQQHREIGALHHFVLVAIVEHRETRGHVGLERKLLQQPGAERVDGLHLQPARRFQRAGEQFASARAQSCIDLRDAGVTDGVVQRGVVERDPVAERGEHPLRHVGGGGLGEGDAQDLFRRHVGEQQPDHALHQHMGLARAGIGRDKRRGGGIGSACLRGANRRRNDTQ